MDFSDYNDTDENLNMTAYTLGLPTPKPMFMSLTKYSPLLLEQAIAKIFDFFLKIFRSFRGNSWKKTLSLIVQALWRVQQVESYELSKFQPPTTLGDSQNVGKTMGKFRFVLSRK